MSSPTGYDQRNKWPIINRFPGYDITHEATAEELGLYCKESCILPDYWKFQALRLQLARRNDFWKLDHSKDGWLAGNFTPQGAAAVVRDTYGQLRFPVWNGYQLHGDVGERLGLKKKYGKQEWIELMALSTSETRLGINSDNDTEYWCLGDMCPWEYQFPRDWDVLGDLPPRKKPKAVANNSNLRSTKTENPQRTSSPRIPPDDVRLELAGLQKEITKLRNDGAVRQERSKQTAAKVQLTNAKIQALVKFAAHQHNVITCLSSQFSDWKTDPDNRKAIETSISATIDASDEALTSLGGKFPGLGNLVGQHENGLEETGALVEWLEGTDHIEFAGEKESSISQT